MAQAKKGNRIIWIAGAIVLGVGGYFGYKYFKKKKDEKKAEEQRKLQEQQQIVDDNKPKPSGSGSGSGGGSGGGSGQQYTSNPFKNATELQNFQKWVLEKKKDTTILGSAGADGKWGRNSASAWDKYGKEYLGSQGSSSPKESGSVKEADIQTITKDGRGVKSDRSYISKTQYPSFFEAWASAIRERINSGGKAYTTFLWYNQLYDSYYGNRVTTKTIMGKKAFALKGARLRTSAKQSSTYIETTPDTSLGTIISWRYNVEENLLYVKTDKNVTYAWVKYNYIYTNK